jgi:ubiquinone/menaquinone biosynthesis C-methylase UbiE
MSFVPRDVIILPEMAQGFPDRWLAMNVFAKTSLGVSSEVLALLSRETSGGNTSLPETFICWEAEYYSNERGLLSDPTRYHRKPEDWRECRLAPEAMLDKLRAHCILVDDEAAYRTRFQPKRNLLDRERFGNFHQQHGQYMMTVRREDPADWWMRQKFTEDLSQVRQDNLYGGVQWSFLREFASKRMAPGMKIVDLGCGTGLYSNLFAECGADVLGLDPSDEYLKVARDHAVKSASFAKANIGEAGGLALVPDGSADMVFMSDALLFYFVPFYPAQKADIQVLLADIRRMLKPGGRFISLEPHAAFYLAPWLGDANRPFTVITEYLHKKFGVVPSFSWLVHSFAQAGFAVADLLEVGPAEYFKEVDPRGYHFAREFPLWQLLELIVVK